MKRYVNNISVNYNIIDANNIFDIYKHLMIIGLLSFSGTLATKCMSLNKE